MMTELEAAENRLESRQSVAQSSKAESFKALATAMFNASRDNVQLKQKLFEAREKELLEVKRDLFLENLRKMLPESYREYLDLKPPHHEGNQKAIAEIKKLEHPNHLHIHGVAGTTKSHMIVHLAGLWIKKHCLAVKFWKGPALYDAYMQFDGLVNLKSPDILLIDDIDKIIVSQHSKNLFQLIYQRLENGKPLVTTANRSNLDLSILYSTDEHNAVALKSRMTQFMLELEVTGEDYRRIIKGNRFPN